MEQIASAHERGAKRGGANAAEFRGFNQHPRIARMHGQTAHLMADGGEFICGFVQRAEHAQKIFGAFDGGGIGFVEPIEGRGFADVKGMEQEDDFGEVAALDFGSIAIGPIQMAAFGPETITDAWSGSTGAAFALVGRSAADRFDEKSADASLGIVTGNTRLAAVHDVPDAINGDGKSRRRWWRGTTRCCAMDSARRPDPVPRVGVPAVERNEREAFLAVCRARQALMVAAISPVCRA